MTSAGSHLVERLRALFVYLDELERVAPGDVDLIVAAMVAHLRARRPVAVAPLSALGPPTEKICDPRRPL